MKYKTPLSLFALISITFFTSAQINFTNISWEDVLIKAQKEEKSIFVDVYTTWCAPCKKLSKTTFQDEGLGKSMNERFISIKWDAESEAHEALSNKYEVSSFPTLLYFSPEGELIRKETGFKTVVQLQEINKAHFSFLEHPELKEQLANYTDFSLEETTELLTELSGLAIKEKKGVFRHFLQLLEKNEIDWKEHLDIILDNTDHNDSISHIEKVIDLFPAPSRYDFGKLQENLMSLKDLERILLLKTKHAIKENDLAAFNKISATSNILATKTTPSITEKRLSKAHKERLLTFYEKNELKSEYALLADSFVQEFIIPYSPKDIQERDEQVNKLTVAAAKMLEEHEKAAGIVPDKEDKYIRFRVGAYFKGKSLADISGKFLDFFDDKHHLYRAERWAVLATEYIPLPRFFLNAAKILYKNGKKEDAKAFIEKGLDSDILTDEVKTELENELGKY